MEYCFRSYGIKFLGLSVRELHSWRYSVMALWEVWETGRSLGAT